MKDCGSATGIRFEDVGFAYASPNGDVVALSNISLSLAPGELLAVVGPNGSGKSTLAQLANGLLVPGRGRVTVDGAETSDPDLSWDIRTRAGIVFQNPDNQIVGTVVEEDVAFGPENLGVPSAEIRRRVDAALATVGLDGLERREPHLLSGGQKQRLAIAGVLALDPAYVIFDEPTAMLDPEGRESVLALIDRLRSDGRGIMHITHHLMDVAHADRVLVLVGGSVVYDGTPDRLVSDDAQLRGWGLTLPPLLELEAELRQLGAQVPSRATSPDSIVRALWP